MAVVVAPYMVENVVEGMIFWSPCPTGFREVIADVQANENCAG